MAPTYHALGMIGAALGTAVLCVSSWQSRPTARKVVTSLLTGLAVQLLASFSFAHLCNRGYPGMQILLWTVGLTGIFSCVLKRKIALIAALTLSIVMGLLCSQYVTMVHHDDLTGNPSPLENHRLLALRGDASREISERARNDPAEYSAGWLRAAPFIQAQPSGFEFLEDEHPSRIEILPYWHSSFTRLWKRREHEVDLWFNGGPLSEARLEWRDRPAAK